MSGEQNDIAVPKREQAAARAVELRKQVEHHQYRYYALDDPEISDQAFDLLFKELQAIEDAYPDRPRTKQPDCACRRRGVRAFRANAAS